jgi:hypothetical protein
MLDLILEQLGKKAERVNIFTPKTYQLQINNIVCQLSLDADTIFMVISILVEHLVPINENLVERQEFQQPHLRK